MQFALSGKGVKVTPQEVGSDFAIENDVIQGDKERVLEVNGDGGLRLFVEVKSTVQDHVKMTTRQAKDARGTPDDHI